MVSHDCRYDPSLATHRNGELLCVALYDITIKTSRPDWTTSFEIPAQSIPGKSKRTIIDLKEPNENDKTNHLNLEASSDNPLLCIPGTSKQIIDDIKAPIVDYEEDRFLETSGMRVRSISRTPKQIIVNMRALDEKDEPDNLKEKEMPLQLHETNHFLDTKDDGNGSIFTPASTLGPSRGSLFQEQLLLLTVGELRRRMGSRYHNVVVTCLTCLDPGNFDFGDEDDFEDENGIEVGIRYIEKVCVLIRTLQIHTFVITNSKKKFMMRLDSMCV
jgi:hypothetical protein